MAISQILNSNRMAIALLCVFLSAWAFFQTGVRVNGDALWLFGAAEKILDGEKMKDAFFDSNPPMIYLAYIPAALIKKLGLSDWSAILAQNFALIALSIYLTFQLLSAWPGLDKRYVFGITTAYTIAITFFSISEIAQKDHFIAIALLPFLLAQNALTHNHPVKSWVKKTAFIIGTPFILIKPHYGLLPVALLIHRFVETKRLSVISDFDFLSLSFGVLAYAMLIWSLFPDFITDVLPPSMALYLQIKIHDTMSVTSLFAFIILCLMTIIAVSDGQKDEKDAGLFFSFMALLSIIPYFVQMKGFYLHFLPSITFALCSIFVTASLVISNFKSRITTSPTIIVFVLFLAGALFSWSAFISNIKNFKHDDFKNTELSTFIKEHAKNNSFLIEYPTTNIIVPTAYYEDLNIASRFSSIWFPAGLTHMSDTNPKKEIYKNYFAEMVAEDINRHRPGFIAVYKKGSTSYPSIMEHFGKNADFEKALSNYTKSDTLKIKVEDYELPKRQAKNNSIPPLPEDFDVYVLKN